MFLGNSNTLWAQQIIDRYETRLAFRSGFRLGMQLAAEALTNRPELYEE